MKTSFNPNVFRDIDCFMECAAPFTDIRSIQIHPGSLFIKDHFFETDGLVINSYSTSLNLLDHYSPPPKHLLFTLTSAAIEGCKWCGIDIPTNAICVQHSQREYQALIPANWDSLGIMIKEELVLQESLLSKHLWEQTQQPEKAIFKLQSDGIKSFRTKLLSFLQTPRLLNSLINNGVARLEFKNWIIDELRTIFIEIEGFQSSRNTQILKPSRRYRMHTKAMTMIEENLTTPLSIMQICNQIGTTPRSLQLCFKELSGISPLQYIKARKLHAIQQEIFYLEKTTKTISTIAHHYGVSHAGRFSAEYKQMFLELPTETLKRRRGLNGNRN